VSSKGSDAGHIGRRQGALIGGWLGLSVGIVWMAIATTVAPLRITCDAAVPADICADTVAAGLHRGMPRLHPLITEAVVVPGPAFPGAYGHRATVTYSVPPGPAVDVRLFFDAGGHWGGIPSQGDVELALWALLPVVVITAVGAAGGAWAGSRPA